MTAAVSRAPSTGDAGPLIYDTVVIGAGPSGLAAAHALTSRGLSVAVVDRAVAAGGLWVEGREDSAVHSDTTLITSTCTSSVAPFEFRAAGPYPTRHETAAYLTDIASALSADFLFHFNASSCSRWSPDAWRLASEDGRYLDGRTIVFTLGLFSRPKPLPEHELSCARRVIHSAAFAPEAITPETTVRITGAGNSACDVALSCLRHGAIVVLEWPRVPWLLQRFIDGVPSDAVPIDLSSVPDSLHGLATQEQIALEARDECERVARLTGHRPSGLPYESATMVGGELLDALEQGQIALAPPGYETDLCVHANGFDPPNHGALRPLLESLDPTRSFSNREHGIFAVGSILTEGGGFSVQARMAEAVAAQAELALRYPTRSRRLAEQLLATPPDLLSGMRPPRPSIGVPFVYSEALLAAAVNIRTAAEAELRTVTQLRVPNRALPSPETAPSFDMARFIPPLDTGQDDHDLFLIYEDHDRLTAVADVLVAPYRNLGITHVVGKESRGFLLGGVCALALGVGFVAARKPGGYMPGDTISCVSEPDWEGKRTEFRMLRRSLSPGDRVLVVDDWYTTGNQCRAVRNLVEQAGAIFVGSSVLVEEAAADLSDLGTFHAVLRWNVEQRRFSSSPYAAPEQVEACSAESVG